MPRRTFLAGLLWSCHGLLASAQDPRDEPAAAPRGGGDELAIVGTPRPLAGQTEERLAVAFTPDGTLVAAGGEHGIIRVWDVGSGRLVREIKGHRALINAVAVSADGRRIASGGPARAVELEGGLGMGGRLEGAVINVWDTATGRRICAIDPVSITDDLAFGSGSESVAAILPSSEPNLTIWRVDDGRKFTVLGGRVPAIRGFSQDVWSRASFTPDLRRVAARLQVSNALHLWDVGAHRTRYLAWQGQVPTPALVALSPDGRAVAVLSHNQALSVWDFETGALLQAGAPAAKGRIQDWPTQLAFDPAGRRVISGGTDGVLRVWDAGTAGLQQTLAGPAMHVRDVAFLDGRIRVISGGWLVARSGPAEFSPLTVWEIGNVRPPQ